MACYGGENCYVFVCHHKRDNSLNRARTVYDGRRMLISEFRQIVRDLSFNAVRIYLLSSENEWISPKCCLLFNHDFLIIEKSTQNHLLGFKIYSMNTVKNINNKKSMLKNFKDSMEI